MPHTADQRQPPQAITPVTGPVDATVSVPGSKSLTNRALCLAALASGTSTLRNALFSDDTHYFGAALKALGIEVREDRASATITVDGRGGTLPAARADLFVGLAGTAARFLTAVLALGSGCYTVDGAPRMRERPMDELLTALAAQGARISADTQPVRMPFTICGGGLAGGELQVSGVRSSQPISALLMVAPLARGATTLEVEKALVSAPFVDMTLRLIKQFGGTVRSDQAFEFPARLMDAQDSKVNTSAPLRRFSVDAGQRYEAQDLSIEPDVTSASYFFAAAAVTGGCIRVPGLRRDSLQGDVAFLGVLEEMGCQVKWDADSPSVTVQGPPKLAGVDVDLTAISDTAPTLAAIAPFAAAPVTIRGIGHTRLQETDRVHALATELRRIGVPVEEAAGSLRIEPAAPRGATIETYDDHRIAMAFAVTGLRTPGISIADPGCTAKTFPDFFARFSQLHLTSQGNMKQSAQEKGDPVPIRDTSIERITNPGRPQIENKNVGGSEP